MAYQRRVPLANAQLASSGFRVFQKSRRPKFAAKFLFKGRNPSEFANLVQMVSYPPNVLTVARKVGSCFWSGRFCWCITSFASMMVGGFIRSYFFQHWHWHVDTDMGKMHLSPWNFVNFSTQNDGIYIYIYIMKYMFQSIMFGIYVDVYIFWGCILGIFQHTTLEATDATVYEGILFIWRFEDGQLGYAPGVCQISIGFLFSNEWIEIREVNNIFRHADVSGDFFI